MQGMGVDPNTWLPFNPLAAGSATILQARDPETTTVIRIARGIFFSRSKESPLRMTQFKGGNISCIEDTFEILFFFSSVLY